MRFPILLALAAAMPSSATAQERFPLTIGVRDSLRSTILNETRRFLVYTPPSYGDTTQAPQRYPVLYLLDGDAHFHSVSGLVQNLGTGINGTWAIPEMMVVAIPNTDRTRDMTPTKVDRGPDGKPSPFLRTSGGMANFLRFIRDELAPRIDSTYRTSPYRIFVGHSLGGITVINALYTMPEAFNAYVAIDPSLWWDDQVLVKQARERLERSNWRNKVLYLGQANTLNPDDSTTNQHFNAMLRFNGLAEAYSRSGLRYGYRYYPEDTHGSVPLITTYDALRFIFQGYQVNLGRVLATPSLLPGHYRAVSERLGATFRPSEGTVLSLAQFAINQDTARAIEFYELASAMYPESPRALDRLAALWAARGDRQKADGYARRSQAIRAGTAGSGGRSGATPPAAPRA